jgi:23S rRNA (uracil1939-C5)-methyltransferase
LGRKDIAFSLLQDIEIGPVAAEGNCVARVDNRVVFVKYAAPGDVADLQITGKKKKFFEARILQLKKSSELRTEPFCKHYGICGGCKWQHLSYAEQLKAKQQQIIDNLERIGGVEIEKVHTIIGGENDRGYRNKLEFSFSNKAWQVLFDRDAPQQFNALGFHIPGRFDKILHIDECHLMPEPMNAIRLAVFEYCEAQGFTFFDPVSQTGFMRNLMLRCTSDGKWMVLVSFRENLPDEIEGLLKHLQARFPEITSLLFAVNDKRNDSLYNLDIQVFSGEPWLQELFGGLQFRIRPKSFFQTNPAQALRLYEATRRLAGLNGTERVYDLYTGTGSIALFVAAQAAEVVGVEYVPEAIEDAHENAALNGIENCRFFAGDMKAVLTPEFIATQGRPDVVITDPPRDGMHPDVVARILEMSPERVVYVSCNPATQARDLALMKDHYRVAEIQPVDMFPNTHHVENIALLLKR